MLFDRQIFKTTLRQLKVNPRVKLHYWDITDSTNKQLWQSLEGDRPLPQIAIAQQQTAGRGQWGRQWQSSPGGLYLSVAVAPQISISQAPLLTFATAWGIASSLRRYAVPVHLKWPNDLILQQRKLGGIKTETRTQGDRIVQAVVGVGINWSNAVPEPGINLQTFFRDRDRPPISCLEQLAAIALFGILSGCQRLQTENRDAILTAYTELLCWPQRPLIVDNYPGKIAGVAPTGALRIHLQTPHGKIEIERMPGAISLGYDDL
ncbi:MAG: biotin--[acetyl-CoA-carboxylase] ligase [Jaaginema sp. PMC 1079.18]|nr:biotin--[acetyl-CoA-carboxylase] ligase [Jaaginema sp. PMC 1080.18]MEC4852945.1 biotin--[acetyl-CoA-carboxylase] ligase [Jaaginema sp. PMC 1079.18]MEC4868864.1 biotin--[acetyl-CoA-carboxylase] ligase [Jaaginema sp. PMC 1078.18]